MTDPSVDIYTDEMEPYVQIDSVRVKVILPAVTVGDLNITLEQRTAWAVLEIELGLGDPHLVHLAHWHWFGVASPKPAIYNSENWHLLDVRKEVYEWLVEWDLIRLQAIGPEDAEYFATDKLLELTKGVTQNGT